jgi:ribonuclease P protein component
MRKPETVGRETPPARLKTRAEFLRAAKGRRLRMPCFNLQMHAQPDGLAPQPPRFGFTVTKKLGGAVLRNRIRRRLKEALRRLPALSVRPGHDYVIVAQPAALTEDFAELQQQIRKAVADIHMARPARGPKAPNKNPGKATPAAPTPTKD